jgi:hypothetical protein
VKIPGDPVARKTLYDQLVSQCLASRSERFEFYKGCRNYFLFGSLDDQGAPYNKIGETVETLQSFIYSPEGVRFSIRLGVSADATAVHQARPMARELTEQWKLSKTHLRAQLAARWSLVFGCMIMKVQWRRGIARTYLVEPHQFGVLREDIVDLEDQEAFCMCYTTTRTQLESDLEDNPRKHSILARIGTAPGGDSSFGGGLSRLLLANPVGGVQGSVAQSGGTAGGTFAGGLGGRPGQGTNYSYAPRVEADLIDMCDLYVFNDETMDYQVVTMASPEVVIYDREQRFVAVPGIPQFAVIRAENNLYDYFWGDSFVARLAWLQEWLMEEAGNVRLVQGKQADPPMSMTGMGGIQEEKLLAMRRRGGIISSPMPNAKVDVHAPKLPENIFAVMERVEQWFDAVAGIGHILQGKGESGVRSKGQADLMARLGSSRPKQRATAIEESIEDVATIMLRNIQQESEQRFQAEIPGKDETLTFTAEQFTTDFEVKVDAHSSSPIFVEDAKHDAETLLEAHAIDRETFLEMYDPPNVQDLKERLKVIEKKEAEAQQAKLKAEAAGHAQKGHAKG